MNNLQLKVLFLVMYDIIKLIYFKYLWVTSRIRLKLKAAEGCTELKVINVLGLGLQTKHTRVQFILET